GRSGIEDLAEQLEKLLLLGRCQPLQKRRGLRQPVFQRYAQLLARRRQGQQAKPPVGGIRAALDQAARLERVGQRGDVGGVVVQPPGQLGLRLRRGEVAE